MNIFILDTDPKLCAQYHCDAHVNKMILESAQMLATAIRMSVSPKPTAMHYITAKGTISARKKKVHLIDSDTVQDGILVDKKVYINCYENHPCTQWVRESLSNYRWLELLVKELEIERIYRGYNPHKSAELVKSWTSLPKLKDIGLTPFARAIGEDISIENIVEAYKEYYRTAKSHLLQYTKRKPPEWL